MTDITRDEVVHTEYRFPVSVVMERREKKRGRWSFTEWKVTGVLSGTGMSDEGPVRSLVHDDGDSRQYLWRNFDIELIRDGAESYWNNLMASKPAIFVVCREEEELGELEPFLVTANYDEIIGYQEVDDQVFSVPIPPDIYQWLERFVVNHYVPPERRKRKRKRWTDNDEQTPAPGTRH